MRSMYEQGASLERVGNKFGYTAGTLRKHLIILGVICAIRTVVSEGSPTVSAKTSRHHDER